MHRWYITLIDILLSDAYDKSTFFTPKLTPGHCIMSKHLPSSICHSTINYSIVGAWFEPGLALLLDLMANGVCPQKY